MFLYAGLDECQSTLKGGIIKCRPSIGWETTERAALWVDKALKKTLKGQTKGRRKLAEFCSRPRGGAKALNKQPKDV